MSLIRWKNKRTDNTGRTSETSLVRFRTEMDRLFDRFMTDPWNFGGFGFSEEFFAPLALWSPIVDIADNDNQIMIRAEIPGVDPKDINVTVSGQFLTIAGEKKERQEDKGEDYWHCERRFGSFKRIIELPASVDTNKIAAEFDNGVLSIQVPKPEAVKPRHVPVTTTGETKAPRRVPVGAP
jgi:HSP20 family protein